jgi:hypothetical protein
MPDTTHNIRALPIYVEGFNAGQDTGLRIALDAITAERIRQTHMQATHDAASPAAARHEYAAAPSGRRVEGDRRPIPPVTHD